jgi:integrase
MAKEVQPIRDPKKIAAMRKILRASNSGSRDELLFLFGINTALRIGDLLGLTLADVLDSEGKIRSSIELKEQKTGKMRQNPVNEVVQKALTSYLADREKDKKTMSLQSPLFLSREGSRPLSICRQRAHHLLSEAGRSVGLDNIGTHSLRKTFGYHVYKRTNNLALVQKLLNHSSSGDTLRYIGIDREQMDNVFWELNLG